MPVLSNILDTELHVSIYVEVAEVCNKLLTSCFIPRLPDVESNSQTMIIMVIIASERERHSQVCSIKNRNTYIVRMSFLPFDP